MGPEKKAYLSSLQEKLVRVIEEIGDKELVLNHDRLKEFCILTGHDYESYKTEGTVPLGYLMTFTDPIVSELFVKLFVELPGMIKGVIHTCSKVEAAGPWRLGGHKHLEKIEVKSIKEKTGTKGEYLVLDFKVTLMDEDRQEIASDLHQFFLRV